MRSEQTGAHSVELTGMRLCLLRGAKQIGLWAIDRCGRQRQEFNNGSCVAKEKCDHDE